MIMQVTGMCWCSGGVLCFNLARDDSTGGYEVGYYDALGTYIWETWPRYICGDTGVGVDMVTPVMVVILLESVCLVVWMGCWCLG